MGIEAQKYIPNINCKIFTVRMLIILKPSFYSKNNLKPSCMFLRLTHGFVWLKMKKALPSGMGVTFSLRLKSDSL